METPIKINIDNNPYYSNKKEIEQVNELIAKKTKEFNERFFKEHCIPNSLLKEKGKLLLIPNPDLDNSWLKRFKETPLTLGTAGEVDTCNGKDFELLFWSDTKPTDSEIAIGSSFRKLQEIKTTYKKQYIKNILLLLMKVLKKKDYLIIKNIFLLLHFQVILFLYLKY